MKPIAQILREKAKQKQLALQKQKENERKEVERLQSLADLERKIEELEDSSSSDDNDVGSSSSSETDDDSDGSSDDEKNAISDGSVLYERDDKGNIIRIISSLAKESSIQPLPTSLLPAKRCKFANNSSTGDNRKRKIAFADERPSKSTAMSSQHGFLRTVKEVIESYVPASQEKKPFYCRVCVFQGKDLADFEAHRASEAHKAATSTESKICFCKLCRKKFTSPAQLSEHLQGKAHKERLEHVKNANQQRKSFC